jgi:hypothetical protein
MFFFRIRNLDLNFRFSFFIRVAVVETGIKLLEMSQFFGAKTIEWEI